jgi:hypothetical protein
MAKFLTTVGNSFYIEQLIINSTKYLTLVTPYLKLSRNVIERIFDADREGIKITLIYGKSELAATEKKTLFQLKNIEIFFCENLHAKCYFNDDTMIITSMNLYEFSERNNREMGLLIEKDVDLHIYNDALKEIESIKNSSIKEKSWKETTSEPSNKESSKLQLHPKYNERWNFYLPSLSKILREKYSHFDVKFDESIRIYNFPIKGIDLEINGRIDFKINNKKHYDLIKEQYRDVFNVKFPDIRFYWNYKQLNIYPEKDFHVNIDMEGLEKLVEKNLYIIETVQNNFKSLVLPTMDYKKKSKLY